MITRILSLGAATVFAALGQQQAGTGQTPGDPALIGAMIDKGKSTYAERCSHCHGFGMINAGTVAPDLRKFPHDQARFVSTVKLGKNNKMPPWGDLLSDDQIDSLWAYVSSQRKP